MKRILKSSLLALSALCYAGPGQASVTINVKGTLKPPTCTVTAPSTVPLGVFLINVTKTHPPFEINVDCPEPVMMELSARSNALGGYADGSAEMLDENGLGGATKFGLQETPGVNIDLFGRAGGEFCLGTDTRVCQLTPVVRAQSGNVPGKRTLTISFSLRYKA